MRQKNNSYFICIIKRIKKAKRQRKIAELAKRVKPLGLYRYAVDYFQAYKVLSKEYPDWKGWQSNRIDQVKYFLLGHSLELGFKAFLYKKGTSLYDLIYKLGHNLVKCKKLSQKNGLAGLIGKDKEVIRMLNSYYSKKEFEYIVQGFKNWPSFEDTENLAEKILSEIAASPDCKNEKTIWEKRKAELVEMMKSKKTP